MPESQPTTDSDARRILQQTQRKENARKRYAQGKYLKEHAAEIQARYDEAKRIEDEAEAGKRTGPG